MLARLLPEHIGILEGIFLLGLLGLPAGAGGRWLRRSATGLTVVGVLGAGTAVDADVIGGAGASAGGAKVQINHLSAGRIPDGAQVRVDGDAGEVTVSP